MIRRPPRSTLFPYTPSSDLADGFVQQRRRDAGIHPAAQSEDDVFLADLRANFLDGLVRIVAQDRKSTRLNSSHLVISYAVFCLKKKKRSESVRRARAPSDEP